MSASLARRSNIAPAAVGLALLGAAVPGLSPSSPAVAGAAVAFESMLPAADCVRLLAADGRLYGGLPAGGVVVWDPADPEAYVRWTTAEGLSSDQVVDLAHSGRSLWVATANGGLTRIRGGAAPEFRRLTATLEQMELSAVAATVRDGSEIAYYGLPAGGVGVVIDGLPGIVYTTANSDLVDDRVQDLAVFQGALWVATPAGISRFAGNVFGDRSAGLPDPGVRVLAASGDTLLLAGTEAGVARWDVGAQAWQPLAGVGGPVADLAALPEGIWALLAGESATDRLYLRAGDVWVGRELPLPLTRAVAGLGNDLWVAGEARDPEMSFRSGRAFLARREPETWATWTTDESLMPSAGAVAVGPDGGLWVGSRTADAFGRLRDGAWLQIWRTVSAADSAGLFNHDGPILDLTVLPDGEVWLIQFDKGGLLRLRPPESGRPTAADFSHVTPDNSALSTTRLLALVRHPDGPLLVLGENGVDVLLAPDAWRDPDSWVHLSSADGLGGDRVAAAAATARDVIWFAVQNVGLVRWDLNGPGGAGGDLTWRDETDDLWSAPVTSLPRHADLSPATTAVLAADPDGSLWAGMGGSVAHLAATTFLDVIEVWREKVAAEEQGLLPKGAGGVVALDLAPGGDVWVAVDTGINRILRSGGATGVEAYVSPVTYVERNLALLYSPDIIAGLPAGACSDMAISADGRRLLVGLETGAATAAVPAGGFGADPLSGLYLYPNPYRPGRDGDLKLGGIAADVRYSSDGIPLEGGAAVAIYNLEGELVFGDAHVEGDVGFWDGLSDEGVRVATGLYVVRITLAGHDAVKTLALVR